MKEENVIDTFGEPEYRTESYLEIHSENVFVMADFDDIGYVSNFAGDPEKFEINGQNLNHDYDTLVEIFGREPDSEEMHALFELRWYYDGYFILIGLDDDGLPGKAEIWDENSYYTYEETYDENYIDENFEWVQKPTLTKDLDPYISLSYIEGIVRNKTDKTFSYVSINFDLYDAVGNQVDTTFDVIGNLSGNNTWKFKAPVSANKGVSRFEFAKITAY